MQNIHLIPYFEHTARQHAEKIAVHDNERAISFASLRAHSLRFATDIHGQLNGQTQKIIAVFLPKCIELIVANLGILYSGNAYMNLDVKNPPARIRAILEHIRPAWIVTTRELAGKLENVSENNLLFIDEVDTNNKNEPSAERIQALENARKRTIDTDPACIINTSGSTGTPKGVILNHRSFLDFTERVIELGLIQEEEVVGSLSPAIFDIYSFELCMLMAKGSALVLIPEKFSAFPVRILELLERHQVTYLFWVPTIMVNIANMDLLANFPLPSLRMVWFAGEVFPTPKFNYWAKKLPHTRFANFYGPIEITLDCTYFLIDREIPDHEPIPIGHPFPNTDVLVLDEHDQPAPDGEEGELCVRGTSLAMGYYNDPQKTAAAFVQNPLNPHYPELIYRTGDIVARNARGELVYKGRRDTIIKHQGYRIELAEIEHAAINLQDGIQNCCALYDKTSKHIVLIYEADANGVDESRIRAGLLNVLPKYMMPAKLVRINLMPRNANGKIDRLALREQYSSQ